MEGMFLAKNRSRIQENYQKLEEKLPHIFKEISRKIGECDEETALACKYLYTTMPYSDMGNYSFETFLDFAAHGVYLWKEKPQVKALPEEIFLNYVLYHRINEEEIAPCRSLFCKEIGSRVDGKTVEEAVIEVNFWCAREATYHSTDERTLSALTVYRRGNGRCGEESVFTVNALRSVGIPARQVYAPRWSHCDDNHAWFEVWCNGTWHFQGACEPEMVLDRGWFNNASSRAMMVHSRLFDVPFGEGEIIGREGLATMTNELSRYARTKEITVKVTDTLGNPVKDAEVFFEVLNYSEYFCVAEKMTDETGTVKLTTGLGSFHISVSRKDGDKLFTVCGFIDAGKEDTCILVLKEYEPKETWQAADIIAPLDAPVNTNMPDEKQKETGRLRLAQVNALREKKTKNWVNPECAAFMNKKVTDMTDALGSSYRRAMLSVISEKDRTDCISEVLEEHLDYSMPYSGVTSEETYVNYVMNPRIDNEIMRKYRQDILEKFSTEEQDKFRENPREIWETVDKMIVSCPEGERASVITTPAGCLKTGIGSFLSKKILFVAIARTLGIPARLNPSDKSMEYMAEGEFVSVLAQTQKNCTLVLEETDGTVWKYFQNWSIAKMEEGRYVSLKLENKVFEERKLILKLETGDYRIITSNRLPNGNIFANQYEFSLHEGQEKHVEMKLRQANLEDMLENISILDFPLKKEDGTQVNASEITEGGKHILLFLEEEKEPTEHILNEMMEQKEEFRKYVDRIVFIVRTKEALSTPTLARTLETLGNVKVYYDDFSEIINTLGRRMYVDPDKLPLIIVTNGKLNGIYATSGYNVGTGDMLLRLM